MLFYNISHQTVDNYAKAAAVVLDDYIKSYPYILSDNICGDETYVKISGKTSYVFFMSDAIKKIITSHEIRLKRDAFSAVYAIQSTLSKFKEIPKTLQFVVDGNPVYIATQQFFKSNGIDFDIHQVIGLTNKDKTSKVFRPEKQITERLNRTYKEHYLRKSGFSNLCSANSYMVLFTAYFNFLRPHTSLYGNVHVVIEELKGIKFMANKWQMLLHFAQQTE